MHKQFTKTRVCMMLFSMLPMSFGVTLFSLSGFGVDPYSGMNMSLAAVTGLSYGTAQLLVNFLLFFIIFFLDKRHFHVGTVINMVVIGYLVDIFKRLWLAGVPQAQTLLPRVLLLAGGVLILSFGAALYFTAALGVAPYDAAAFILVERGRLPYAAARILTDVFCVAVSLLCAAGNVGAGTLVSALCLGPVIALFTRICSEPLLKLGEGNS